MNIIAAIIAAITTHFAGNVIAILSQIPALLVQGVLTLIEDERTILAKALDALLADIKAGKNWEQALTDAYNVFYSGEVSEGNRIAMAFLETLAKIVSEL